MMSGKVFGYECRKVLKAWFLWGLLGIFLAFDLFLVWEDVGYDRAEYRKMYQTIRRIGAELESTEVKNTEVEKIWEGNGDSEESPEDMDQAYAAYVKTYEGIYDTLKIAEIKEAKIGISVNFKPEGAYQSWIDRNYERLEMRVREIRETGEARRGFYPGLVYEVHSKLFRRLFRVVLLELSIMTAFSVLYLMDYERLQRTESIVFCSKTGRSLLFGKWFAGMVCSFIYAMILVGVPVGAFLWFVPMNGLWDTAVSSFMVMERRGLFVYPFITFVPLRFGEYLGLVLVLMVLFLAVIAALAGAVQYFCRNSYSSMLCVSVAFLVGLALPFLVKSGFGHTAAILNPAALWYMCGAWFMENEPAISFAWSEFWTVGVWLLAAGTGLLLGKGRFGRADIG